MLTQTSVHTKVSPASPEPDQLNYTFTYQYNGPRPHAATQIGPWAYTYDANGNVIEQHWIGGQGGDNGQGNGGNDNGNHGNPKGGVHDNDGNFRFGHHQYGGAHGEGWGMQNPHYGQGGGLKDQSYVWDEENRLIHSFGPGGPTDYLYDYNGERALKRGEHGETWYIDRYYQIQNGHMIEKHIFVGDTRVVTRLEDSDFYDSGYEDHNIFYYHPDHLGSTTFVTTQDGHEWEHMEYTPYGQQWIDEGTDRSIITYRFTSKEYDSETGLYYYGARYLDPVTARWMTPDPIFKEYLPATPTSPQVGQENAGLPGQGGVFNAFNLALYSYSDNNPVKYLDPSGLAPGDQFSTMLAAVTDFGKTYNDDSIRKNAEYGATVYTQTNAGGLVTYTYSVPNRGEEAAVVPSLPPNGQQPVGIVHTHGAYSPYFQNNEFSPSDMEVAKSLGVPIYVATPNGSLQGFYPNSNTTALLSTSMPSDPNDPDRLNQISPYANMRDDPYHGLLGQLGDFLKTGGLELYRGAQSPQGNQNPSKNAASSPGVPKPKENEE